MYLKAGAIAALALLLLAWATAASQPEYVDIGAGLLLRPDGSVVAAWELPGSEGAADAFDAPDTPVATTASRNVWQVRIDHGW